MLYIYKLYDDSDEELIVFNNEPDEDLMDGWMDLLAKVHLEDLVHFLYNNGVDFIQAQQIAYSVESSIANDPNRGVYISLKL